MIKYIPVIVTMDGFYIKTLNEEARKGLQVMYASQFFPVIGDTLCVPGWDGHEVKSRDIILNPLFPTINLYINFWSRQDEEQSIYEAILEQYGGGYPAEEIISAQVSAEIGKVVFGIFEVEKIYKTQMEVLNAPEP